MIRPSAPEELTSADLVAEGGAVLELSYSEPDRCALPSLVVVEDEVVKFLDAGQVYQCPHLTWTSITVQIRGGYSVPAWIVRPPVEPLSVPTTTPT